MAGAYPNYGSYILFKQFTDDVFGHLCRAGELGRRGIRRTVFLRTLDAPQVPVEEVIQSFPMARRLARELTAANVAGGAEYLVEGNVPALACDYLSAQPLNLVLDRARSEDFPIPVDNALLVLEKISLALTAGLAIEVEGNALVHGLLHPGLILLSMDGEAVVTGFGVAGSLLGMLGHHEVAQQLHPYLAPEVLLTRTPSKRADVYSLGALLVEMLTRTVVPAEPEERIGLIDRLELAHDERPLPDDLKALLRRSLAPRPGDRFNSAVEFKKELDRLLYGGSYSPTTFNLALFMDRLFRAEIETEERERTAEASLDLTEYLAREPEPEPESLPISPPSHRRMRGVWIGGALAVAVAVAGWWALAGRAPSGPDIPPTPTAEQIAAQRQREEARLQAMVQELVQQQMAEKEEEIRQELLDRQAKIDDLQRRLRASEQRSRTRQPSPEEQRQRQELQQKIAAEEEAQRQQQSGMVDGGSPELEGASRGVVANDAAAGPPLVEQQAATPEPTVATPPTPVPTPTRVVVLENSFVDPTEVDTPPVLLKEHPVTWPRMALHSRRQGVVIVQVTVNAEGGVDQAKVLRSDHEGFGIPQAVLEAVQNYRFKPATKGGVRVTSYATVTQRYRFADR